MMRRPAPALAAPKLRPIAAAVILLFALADRRRAASARKRSG